MKKKKEKSRKIIDFKNIYQNKPTYLLSLKLLEK